MCNKRILIFCGICLCLFTFKYEPIQAQITNEYQCNENTNLISTIENDENIQALIKRIYELIIQEYTIEDIVDIINDEKLTDYDIEKIIQHMQTLLHNNKPIPTIIQIMEDHHKIENYYYTKEKSKFFLNSAILLLSFKILIYILAASYIFYSLSKWIHGNRGFFKGAPQKTLLSPHNKNYVKKSNVYDQCDNNKTPKPFTLKVAIEKCKEAPNMPIQKIQHQTNQLTEQHNQENISEIGSSEKSEHLESIPSTSLHVDTEFFNNYATRKTSEQKSYINTHFSHYTQHQNIILPNISNITLKFINPKEARSFKEIIHINQLKTKDIIHAMG